MYQLAQGDLVVHVLEMVNEETAEDAERFAARLQVALMEKKWVDPELVCIYCCIMHTRRTTKNVVLTTSSEKMERLAGVITQSAQTNRAVDDIIKRLEGTTVPTFSVREVLERQKDEPAEAYAKRAQTGRGKKTLAVSKFMTVSKLGHLRIFVPQLW